MHTPFKRGCNLYDFFFPSLGEFPGAHSEPCGRNISISRGGGERGRNFFPSSRGTLTFFSPFSPQKARRGGGGTQTVCRRSRRRGRRRQTLLLLLLLRPSYPLTQGRLSRAPPLSPPSMPKSSWKMGRRWLGYKKCFFFHITEQLVLSFNARRNWNHQRVICQAATSNRRLGTMVCQGRGGGWTASNRR